MIDTGRKEWNFNFSANDLNLEKLAKCESSDTLLCTKMHILQEQSSSLSLLSSK